MKYRPHLLAAAVAIASAAPFQASHAQSGAPLIKDGLSPHFMAVASKLELGGAGFTYAEEAGTMTLISDFIDGAIKGLPEKERAQMPPDFSFRTLFSLLGLDRLKATGASSRALADGRYHSRTFAYIPDGRKGLLTLSGGPAEPFLLLELAPAGTDLALEFPLHTKDFASDAMARLSSWVPEKERAQFDKVMNQGQAPLGLSPRQMLEQLSARIGLIARLNPEQQIPAPGITLPGADAALVIDRLGWLLVPVKEGFLPMLANPRAPAEAVEKDGVLTVTFRAPVGPAPMDFQPSLSYDSKKDRLIVATRPAFLQQILNPADKLAGDPAFQQAWQGMPEKGNGCLFVSPRLITTAVDGVKVAMNQPNVDAAGREAALPIIDGIASRLKQAQVFSYANLPDGTYGAANSILPASGGAGSLTTVSAIAVLASLAVPTFNVVQAQANQTKISSEGRQVGMALKLYAIDNDGKYPASLQELAAKKIIEDEGLLVVTDPATRDTNDWLYDASLKEDSPASSIVLATPFTFQKGTKEQRAVVRNDGSAEIISETDFQDQKGPGLK